MIDGLKIRVELPLLPADARIEDARGERLYPVRFAVGGVWIRAFRDESDEDGWAFYRTGLPTLELEQ